MANLRKRLNAVKQMEKCLILIEKDIDADELNFMTLNLINTVRAWCLLYDSIENAIKAKETPPGGVDQLNRMVKRMTKMTLMERVRLHLFCIKEDISYRLKCLLRKGGVK